MATIVKHKWADRYQFGVALSLITEPFPEQTLPETEKQTMCLLLGEVVIGFVAGRDTELCLLFWDTEPQPLR